MGDLEQRKQEEEGQLGVEGPAAEGPAGMGAPIAGSLMQRKIAQRLARKKDEQNLDKETDEKAAGEEQAAPGPVVQKQEAAADAPKQEQKPQSLAAKKHKYSASGAQRAYTIGGHDVCLFLPPGGVKGPAADVFVFFHGLNGNYEAAGGGNTAKAGHLPEAVAASGKIGLAPVGGAGATWSKWKPGDFKAMVDGALAQLSKDLDIAEPLVAGSVSLAGHSAGGNALGQAALDMDVPEVTLQDAGYGKFGGKMAGNYNASWDKLDKWFLTGKGPKTLRVISHDKKGSGEQDASTRYVTENKDHGFSESALNANMSKLIKEGALDAPLKLETQAGDNAPRAGAGGGMRLEEKLVATRPDGTVQGTLYIFHLPTYHDGVRNDSMEAAAKGGGDDFGKIELKPGGYTVTDGQAYVRDEKDLSKYKQDDKNHKIIIPKGAKVKVTEFKNEKDIYAFVDGYGWTKLSNLKADAGGDAK